MTKSLLKRLSKVEPLIKAASGRLEPSVYGVVDKVDNIKGKLVPNIIRAWEGTVGNMTPSQKDPTVLLVPKFEPFILKHKKHKAAYGGRGGMKTIFATNVICSETHSAATKTFCLRERKLAVKDSVKAEMLSAIHRLGLGGFIPIEWEIKHNNGGSIVYGGMQNILDMKGASGFKRFLLEEAEKTKQKTLDVLGPTLRGVPGAELWYLWNTGSSQDPMSKEFIIPYQAQLDKTGFYEDEHHMICKVTYKDNPWFEHDESLQQELEKARIQVKKGIMTKARFRGIWEGAFNDDVANSVIQEDWFAACIDAHKKLGIEQRGAIVCAGDPSDVGSDPFGYIARQGIVFFSIKEIEGENGNRKMDEACKHAIADGADSFGYDADGLGATLRDNVDRAFAGKKTSIYAYKGSASITMPKAEFKSNTAGLSNRKDFIKNEDVLKNRKAQNIISFAERVFKTWEAVTEGKYHDPDELISFDSETISQDMLEKIKAEACKTPIKAGSTVQFYTKPELRKGIIMPDGSRLVIPSPNLFDAAVLSFDNDSIITNKPIPHRPAPIRPIRRR